MYMHASYSGFHPVGEVEGKLPPQNTQLSPPKGKGKKEKERGGGSVYIFGAMIYLITLRLAEYHRLNSITPQCH